MPEWIDIPDYPNYAVSRSGLVRSKERIDRIGRRISEKILKQMLSSVGRPIVGLHNEHGQKTFSVSQLVAAAFLGPHPDGTYVCHNNGDPLDNRAENLRYDTQAGNCADKLKHGTHQHGELIGTSKLTNEDVVEIRKRFSAGQTQSELAREFQTSQTNISSIVLGKTWRHLS